jgi:methylated-DNA-[protein]-cysteine S-methyltransferase
MTHQATPELTRERVRMRPGDAPLAWHDRPMTMTTTRTTSGTTTRPKSCRTVDSPVGPLVLAGRDGALTNLRMQDQTHPPADRAEWRDDPTSFAEVAEQLDEYFAGDRTTFDVELCLEGTDFQRLVWAALLDIPHGETCSYGELARAIGRPGAARAVGLANGHNPIGIIVPCHRVVGADGSLTGYGGGLGRKRVLLDLEQGRAAPRLPVPGAG